MNERRAFSTRYGEPDYKAWERWFADHGFPIHQVTLRGWAERDAEARTVSALVYAWLPGDDGKISSLSHGVVAYAGNRSSPIISYAYNDTHTLTYEPADPEETWMGVLTIQLDREPAPFPEVAA